MSVALLKLSGLSFRHVPSRVLLEGVDLELHDGERIGIVGANGSGKSTLLELLLGLLPAQGGTIEFFGRAQRTEADFRAIRGRVGLLFQDADDQLFCPTLEEDVAFGPLNQGYRVEEARAIVTETLTRLELAHLRKHPTHHLSSGEMRLVGLAGLLAMRPEVLLLDEPSTGLDDVALARVTEILRTLPQAMLIVSHDRAFLRQLTTHVKRLRDGRLQDAARPARRLAAVAGGAPRGGDDE